MIDFYNELRTYFGFYGDAPGTVFRWACSYFLTPKVRTFGWYGFVYNFRKFKQKKKTFYFRIYLSENLDNILYLHYVKRYASTGLYGKMSGDGEMDLHPPQTSVWTRSASIHDSRVRLTCADDGQYLKQEDDRVVVGTLVEQHHGPYGLPRCVGP